ncbi:MAG: cytochrome c [Paracoccaceae bacterium]
MFTRKSALVAALVLGTAASAALAAAMDADVRARQEAMGLIGSNVKKVTQMVKGEVAFDAAGAQAAFAAIAEKADMVPALFETRRTATRKPRPRTRSGKTGTISPPRPARSRPPPRPGRERRQPRRWPPRWAPWAGACKACHSTYKE